MPSAASRQSPTRALLAGLTAGGAAAIVAVFVSLRLRSPDRVWLNAASVGVIVVFAGLVCGLIYALTAGRRRRILIFGGAMAALFVLVALAALLAESLPGRPISGVAVYAIPLAAISLLVIDLLTPLLARVDRRLLPAAPLVAAAGILIAFAVNARTAPSGQLALPQTKSASAPVAGGLLQPADVKGMAFAVDPSQSKATYSVQERLTRLPAPDNAVGTTNKVSGTIYLDGRPSTVTVDVRTFQSDDRGRDAHLLRDPGLANFAPAQFTVSQLDLPSSYKPGDTITTNVQGVMALNNVQKPLSFAIEARYQDGTLFIHGQTAFKFEDFNIKQPQYQEVLSIDDTIHAEILLVATGQS